MARMTITLPDDLHRALQRAAAVRGQGLSELIAESLVRYGVKPQEEAEALVARARDRSRLAEPAALRLAVRETRAARRR